MHACMRKIQNEHSMKKKKHSTIHVCKYGTASWVRYLLQLGRYFKWLSMVHCAENSTLWAQYGTLYWEQYFVGSVRYSYTITLVCKLGMWSAQYHIPKVKYSTEWIVTINFFCLILYVWGKCCCDWNSAIGTTYVCVCVRL